MLEWYSNGMRKRLDFLFANLQRIKMNLWFYFAVLLFGKYLNFKERRMRHGFAFLTRFEFHPIKCWLMTISVLVFTKPIITKTKTPSPEMLLYVERPCKYKYLSSALPRLAQLQFIIIYTSFFPVCAWLCFIRSLSKLINFCFVFDARTLNWCYASSFLRSLPHYDLRFAFIRYASNLPLLILNFVVHHFLLRFRVINKFSSPPFFVHKM